jgi:hypothetical protein
MIAVHKERGKGALMLLAAAGGARQRSDLGPVSAPRLRFRPMRSCATAGRLRSVLVI